MPFDPTRLYPYLVSDAYPDSLRASGGQAYPEIGHGIRVALVLDVGGLVRSVSAEELRVSSLSAEQAYAKAISNLETLAIKGEIQMKPFPIQAETPPFILIGGHWDAASAILLPRLLTLSRSALGEGAICASIPHRAAALLFPCGDRRGRDAMRALVREKESDEPKPLTFDLFELTAEGVKPFVEP